MNLKEKVLLPGRICSLGYCDLLIFDLFSTILGHCVLRGEGIRGLKARNTVCVKGGNT
jgi:hypothetical protein